MEQQTVYAVTRLREISGETALLVTELRGLQQVGDHMALRQIAQHLQTICAHLKESGLLLQEMDLPQLAAYTEQLERAISQFHVQTPSYDKLTLTIGDWLRRIAPLCETEATPVTAAVIGRLMNRLRMGYYPTDLDHVLHIKEALVFDQSITANLLDPCCGCGLALQTLADGQHARTFGAELDELRAAEAGTRLDRVAIGSYFFSSIARGCFHVLFLNPPYLQTMSPFGNIRTEKRFLSSSYEHLLIGGILIYIIPYYRLTEDVCSFLSEHFEAFSMYRFMDSEFQKFHQVVIIGRRKKWRPNEAAAARLLVYALHPETIPLISALPAASYPLPNVDKAVHRFQGSTFNVRELELQMAGMRSMLQARSTLECGEKRPPLPLTIGQIGLVGGSGLINGLIECDAPHILKGRIVKVVDSHESADERSDGSVVTEITETASNNMVFNVLTPQGFIKLA